MKEAHKLNAKALYFPPGRLTCLFRGPLGSHPPLPEALIFFHLSIRHLFLINVLTLKLCGENEGKRDLVGVGICSKPEETILEGVYVFIPFMRDACFPPL